MKKQLVVIDHIPLNRNKGGEMKRNIILSLWLAVLAVVAVVALAAPANNFDCGDYKTVVAEHGDTLWSIVEKHCDLNNTDIREVVNLAIKLNGSVIQQGQLIILPNKSNK